LLINSESIRRHSPVGERGMEVAHGTRAGSVPRWQTFRHPWGDLMNSTIRRSTVLVLAFAAFAACGKNQPEDVVQTVQGALVPDETTPIGQKWRQLQTAGIDLGEAIEAVQPTPGGAAQYQRFASAVIVYSNDFGAVYTPTQIFDKWLSLQTMTDAGGGNVFFAVGLPVRDYVATPGHSDQVFQGGMIIAVPGLAQVIYGGIYQRYTVLAAQLGLPISEEGPTAAAGGRFQRFSNGDMYWHPDVGAFAVTTPVLARYAALGGPSSPLGFPKSDTSPILAKNSTTEIGLAARFQNGVIFYNAAAGAWEVTGNVLTAYETRFGGPNGWLGFPIGPAGTSGAGDPFTDFQGGILVEHAGLMYPLGNLAFHLQRVIAHGDDCGTCGAQDLFYFVNLSTSNGVVVNHKRFPDNGDDYFCQGCDTHTADDDFPLNAVANSALTVDASINVWDDDDTGPFSDGEDDPLGSPSVHYDINNLWGQLPGFDESRRSGDGEAIMNIKSSHDFDRTDFRGQMFWSFENFKTPELTYDQFAQTFRDVSVDEETWRHPFNALYFEAAYKKIAKNGNCFGMSVESIYAQTGRSMIGMPIYEAYPETQTGAELNKALRPGLYNELNVKQGYQVGLSMVLWSAGMFLSGQTHDPANNFYNSLFFEQVGEYPMISIFDDYLFGGGHSVRPYKWDTTPGPCARLSGSNCVKIHIADSNHPLGGPEETPGENASIDDFLEIDLTTNFYDYQHKPGSDRYNGGTWTGGRMFFYPFRVANHVPVTPLAEPWLLASDAYMFLVGSDGETEQVSDGSGKTFYEPGLANGPRRWDQIRQDAATRVAGVAPLMLMDAQLPSTSPIQIFYGSAPGATHSYDLAPTAAATPGAPIQSTFHSGKMSSHFIVPGTPGKVDKITAHDIGAATKAISLTLPADGVVKPVNWTVSGAEKQRWAEFSGMGMSPSQRIRMATVNNGRRVLINNNGPDTTANLRVKGGPGATPVNLGTVSIKGGDNTIDFMIPKTTLTLGNVVNGKDGWLVAPVTVTLTAADRSGFGIDRIEYSNDGVSWTTYTGPFEYSTQGVTTLFYRARDKAFNQETAQSRAFKIDSRLPTTTGSLSTSPTVRLTYTVTDPTPGSGVAGLHIIQGTSSTTTSFLSQPSGTVTLAGTCSAVEFWGEDVAGNTSTPHLKLTDSVAPVFTTVPPAVINTTVCTTAAGLNLGSAAAIDDCGSVTVTHNAPAKFPLGTTIVTWTARDPAGNTTTRTQTVNTDLGDNPSCCPTGSNIMMGTSNSDVLNGTSGPDCIIGLGAQDTIRGNGGNDAISGGEGDDQIWGGEGNDWLAGGTGQDKLRGENGNDTLSGNDGDDELWGGNNDDRFMGGQGQDKINGEAGNDNLAGGTGDDTMNGGTGNDFLRGEADHDSLTGGGGSDQCVQDGADTLIMCTAVAP
jgi:Ca2+-binding RTX toxin-like protein